MKKFIIAVLAIVLSITASAQSFQYHQGYDFKGKAAGRGAYICRSTDCLEKARKARRFEKSFSCKIEESVYEVMMNELGEEPQDN